MADKDARAIIMIPQRDLTTKKLVARFVSIMTTYNLRVLEENTLVGQDDWDGDDDEETLEVKCWCAIFGRA